MKYGIVTLHMAQKDHSKINLNSLNIRELSSLSNGISFANEMPFEREEGSLMFREVKLTLEWSF